MRCLPLILIVSFLLSIPAQAFSSPVVASAETSTLNLDHFLSIAKDKEKPERENDLEARLTREYLLLAKWQELLEVKEALVENLETHYKAIRNLYMNGLLMKLEMIKMQMAILEAKRTRDNYASEYGRQKLRLLGLLPGRQPKDFRVEGFSSAVYFYDGFDHWLEITAKNIGIKSGREEEIMEKFSHPAFFRNASSWNFEKLFLLIDEKARNVETTDELLKKAESLVHIQHVRFTNSLTSSDEVIESIERLYQEKENRINFLADYHLALANAEEALKELLA